MSTLIYIITDEIAGLRNDLQAETDKLEKTRDGLSERLQTTENELQTALKAEKTAHEEDVERLSREKVRLLFCVVIFALFFVYFGRGQLQPFCNGKPWNKYQGLLSHLDKLGLMGTKS